MYCKTKKKAQKKESTKNEIICNTKKTQFTWY